MKFFSALAQTVRDANSMRKLGAISQKLKEAFEHGPGIKPFSEEQLLALARPAWDIALATPSLGMGFAPLVKVQSALLVGTSMIFTARFDEAREALALAQAEMNHLEKSPLFKMPALRLIPKMLELADMGIDMRKILAEPKPLSAEKLLKIYEIGALTSVALESELPAIAKRALSDEPAPSPRVRAAVGQMIKDCARTGHGEAAFAYFCSGHGDKAEASLKKSFALGGLRQYHREIGAPYPKAYQDWLRSTAPGYADFCAKVWASDPSFALAGEPVEAAKAAAPKA